MIQTDYKAIAATTTVTKLVSENTKRKEIIVLNASSATLYLAYGRYPSSTDYIAALGNGDTLITTSQDSIHGVWSSATGQANISELVDPEVVTLTTATTRISTASAAAITSVTPGTGATNLGKAEDAVHASGDVGVMALTVRADTAAATAGTTGDYQSQITDALGLTWMREYYAPGYEDNTNNVAKVEQRFSFLNVAAGQATTVVKSGAGFLHTITFNSAATATNVTTVYDNTAGSGTVIAIPAATTATVPTTLTYDCSFSTGLTIVTATANGSNMTVSYR